jgi:predicted metalloendopeptidase
MCVNTLQASTPAFDWQAYLSEMPGGAKDKVKEVIVRQPDYMKAIDAVIAEVPLATWKEYLTFGLISAYADGLSQPFADSDFEFNGRTIAGRQVQQPRWKRGVNEVEQVLGEPVGRLYIERHFKQEAKARMDALIRNLLAAFKVGVEELEWMSPETKKQAQDKLAKYRLKIAYPDRWRDFSELEVKPGDHVGNLLRFREFQTDESWSRLGQPVERWRWGFTPQTVNASYSATNNEITFPAGILQPPFFNLDADDAINYGAIGAVIGHEISHGFDDQGRKSDGDGNLRDWWTAEDAKKFEERASKLGVQFESYTPLPGMKINGRQTMGENIGDLSGIAVALRAYHISLNGKPAPVVGGFTGDQRFFLGYAQIWRFKSRDEALRNQLLTDSHSPGYYRAFVPLTNIDTFYTAFNLKPGDKLYRAPADRVKIW